MLKIRLLRQRRIVETIDAKWTLDIAEIATRADELEPQHGADDWDLVNEMDLLVLTKARWGNMKKRATSPAIRGMAG